MKIYRNGTEIADVFLQDNSVIVEEIMGEHYVQLIFSLKDPVTFEIHDYITFEGSQYSVRNQETISKVETSEGFDYTVTFYAPEYKLADVSFFLFDEPEYIKNHDFYNGTAAQWAALIVQNMNRADSGWSVGSVIASEPINMSFLDKQCSDILGEICRQLNTEYWIENKTISIGRREYASDGLTLAQGEGMGFRDLEIQRVDDAPPVTRLYVRGSDKNLTLNDYGHSYLTLPGGVTYLEKNTDKYGIIERSKSYDDIFPKGEFTVSAKIDDFTLQASDIDFDLNAQLIDGVEVVVTFQGTSGLAGYDLNIVEGSWDDTTKQFTLAKHTDEDALEVPGDITFSVGDKFIFSDIKYPQTYIGNAENKLLEQATKDLDDICEKRVQLAGKCDDYFFKVFGVYIAPGKMIHILHNRGQIAIDREIRCTRVTRYIDNHVDKTTGLTVTPDPYRYDIVLSDFLQSNGLASLIKEIKQIPDEIYATVQPIKEVTLRRWQDVMQTFEMMFDTEGSYFTEKIMPLAVHTAQLIVGQESMQMNFVGVKFIPNVNGNPNVFGNTAGTLEHFTINTDGTIRTWTIPASQHTLSNNSAYYVYAKCPTSGTVGEILVTTEKILRSQVSGYYHFLIGVLNTPINNVRSWQPMFGYTEIAGNQITTGIIKSRLGNLVINLETGTFTGYNYITDKPDLTQYATTAQLTILGDEISANVTAINTINNTIQTAGWITTAQGNTLYASKTLENGNVIASYINQDATSIKIQASKINLVGQVTFQMLDSSTQSAINGKANASSLGAMAYENYVEAAKLGNTIIEGGYIKASLLNVNSIFANYAYLGNWTIVNGWLSANGNPGNEAFINMRYNDSIIAFGTNVMPPSLSAGYKLTARIENTQNPGLAGKSIGLWVTAVGDTSYYSAAIHSDGGIQAIGALSLIEETAPLDSTISTDSLKWRRSYVFQPTSDLNYYLPSDSQIDSAFGYMKSGKAVVDSTFITVKILITKYATASIYVVANSIPLIDANGNTTSSVKMSKGDYGEFTYHNRNWYITALHST